MMNDVKIEMDPASGSATDEEDAPRQLAVPSDMRRANWSVESGLSATEHTRLKDGILATSSTFDLPSLNNAEAAAPIPPRKRHTGPPPAVLSWSNLTVSTKVGKKQILKGVQGVIAGQFTAVMGPSGCGKSSLLNTLARRLDFAVSMQGELLLNGREYSKRTLKECSGYVMQDDLLNGMLTVAETLYYTAELKLPPSFTPMERKQRIEETAKQMGLMHIQNVIVGDPLNKGISGGERKRLCIAMELLTRPALLFLDEPTSGLDSVTALSLTRTLTKLTDAGHCTIVCTIHQPQAKIFHLFDHLVLLKTGVIMYQGPASKALDAFAEFGYPCPSMENPADHLLDSITPNSEMNSENRSMSPEDEAKCVAKYGLVAASSTTTDHAPVKQTRVFLPWHRQLFVLFRRSVHEITRKRFMMYVQLAQTIVMAVLIGTAFLAIGTRQRSIQRRGPCLFFCVINQGVFGALMVINSFPAERMLALRERASGMYDASAYFLAKTTAEALPAVCFPSIFTFIVYPLIGLQPSGSKFVIFWLLMVLTNLAATSLALAVSAIARTTDLSVIVLPILLEICRLFGGFFLAPSILPIYFVWLDALSYVKYAYTGIVLNEMGGLVLTCSPAELRADGSCPVTRGEQTLSALKLDQFSIGVCAGALVVMIFGFRVIAYLGVRFRTK